MELIKRKILLEDGISRQPNGTYGAFTGDSFYIKIALTQNMDDMGSFINVDFEPSATSPSVSDYIQPPMRVSGLTEDRIEEVRSYAIDNQLIEGFDINREDYNNYLNALVNGRTRVTKLSSAVEYVIDADANDTNIGSVNQDDGFYIKTLTGTTRAVTVNGVETTLPITEIHYKSQGWNETNVTLSALTMEEYLFGITSEPEVFSDVFIDRGIVSVKERHLKLSEVKSLDDLTNYGNGFFNVRK